jgi:hypothetical protein
MSKEMTDRSLNEWGDAWDAERQRADENEADAARYRAIKAAVEAGDDITLYYRAGRAGYCIRNARTDGFVQTGPTLDEAVDQLPAVVPTDREEAK